MIIATLRPEGLVDKGIKGVIYPLCSWSFGCSAWTIDTQALGFIHTLDFKPKPRHPVDSDEDPPRRKAPFPILFLVGQREVSFGSGLEDIGDCTDLPDVGREI